MNPRISIVIPHHERWKELRKTLAKLRTQTFKSFEVIIANHGSSAALRASSYPFAVKVVTVEGDWNVGRARNAGTAVAQAQRLLFMDCDLDVPADFTRLACKRIEAGSAWFPIVRNSHTIYNADPDRWRLWGFGTCGIWRKDLERLGRWDEFSGWGGEDNLLHWKAKQLGLKITREKSAIIHRDHDHATPWHAMKAGVDDRIRAAQKLWSASRSMQNKSGTFKPKTDHLPIYRIWPGKVRSQRAYRSWKGHALVDVPAVMAAKPEEYESRQQACSLSHAKVLREFLKTRQTHCIVIEDDAVLLNPCWLACRAFDLFMPFVSTRDETPGKDFRVRRNVLPKFGTQAYIASRRFAEAYIPLLEDGGFADLVNSIAAINLRSASFASNAIVHDNNAVSMIAEDKRQQFFARRASQRRSSPPPSSEVKHVPAQDPSYPFINRRAVEFVKLTNCRALAEIGVGRGQNARAMAEWVRERGTLDLFDYADQLEIARSSMQGEPFRHVRFHANSRLTHDNYNWSLMKLLQQQSEPIWDYVYLDGAHTWTHDACAFFLIDRLLKPGGYIEFDDYFWSFSSSPTANPSTYPPVAGQYTAEQIQTSHIGLVVDLLVKKHPGYSSVVENRIYRKAAACKEIIHFVLTVFDESEHQLDWCLRNLRELYPTMPVSVVSDGRHNPFWERVCTRRRAKYVPSTDRLKSIQCGAKWWQRFCDVGLSVDCDRIVKMDPDTLIQAPLPALPQVDLCGTLQKDGVIQGGFQMFRREAIEKLSNSKLCRKAEYRKPEVWVTNGLTAQYVVSRGEISTDYVLKHLVHRLGMSAANWSVIDSQWKISRPFRELGVAVTHPHKLSPSRIYSCSGNNRPK